MISPTDAASAAPGAAAPTSSRIDKLYFAAWRWHFYAGLFVIPFLLVLAVTGMGMMLLTTVWPEYGDRLVIEAGAEPLPVAEQVAAAIAAVPGGTGHADYITAYSAANPVLVTVTGPETPVVVALDPTTGEALRLTPEGATWNAWLETVHGTLLIGGMGDRLIEVAAGLAFVLLATGLYLWWPRQGRGWRDLLVPRLSARGRALWKSLHMVTGFWISAILLIFLVTGMSWTGVWGERWVQAWSTFPAETYEAPPSDVTHASLNAPGEKRVPWGLEQTLMPASDAGTAHHGGGAGGADHAAMDHGPVAPGASAGAAPDLAAMVALGMELGLAAEGRFRVTPPEGETGVWTLARNSMSYDSPNPTADRTVHVDRYTGNVLADVRYADYGLAAKDMAVGIALHEGQMGLWNLVLNAVALLLIVVVCVTGVAAWWLRRPRRAGRLAAPPRPEEMPLWKGALAFAIGLSMLFPLVGAVLIATLVLDVLVIQRWPGLRRALS